jgi:hypothetical protein
MSEILLSFDLATDQSQMTRASSCDAMLTPDTISLVEAGSGASPGSGYRLDCYWLDDYAMVITWEPDATWAGARSPLPAMALDIGTVLHIKAGVFKSRDGFSVSNSATNVTVAAPLVVPAVVPVLVGPTSIGGCDDLTLSAVASTGNAARPFTVAWEATSSGGTDEAPIHAYLEGQGDGAMNVTVPGSYLEPGVEYTFTVNLRNWLMQPSEESTTASITVLVSSLDLPSAANEGPSLWAATREEITVLRTSFTHVPCSGDGTGNTLTVEWMITPHAGQDTPEFSVTQDAEEGFSVMTIPENVLVPDSFYTVSIT